MVARRMSHAVRIGIVCALLSLGLDAAEERWLLRLEGIFKAGEAPMMMSVACTDGAWSFGIADSRHPDEKNRPMYNRSHYHVDARGLRQTDDQVSGTMIVHLTPDLWVPADARPAIMHVAIEATRDTDGLRGHWTLDALQGNPHKLPAVGATGTFMGTQQAWQPVDLPQRQTVVCNLHGALVGGHPRVIERCLVAWIGLDKGKLTTLSHGTLSRSFAGIGRTGLATAGSTWSEQGMRFEASFAVPTMTLDIEPCRYEVTLTGARLDRRVSGTWQARLVLDGSENQQERTLAGAFDGTIVDGIQDISQAEQIDWYVSDPGFEPVAAGEHPRLLFRRADLQALRAKARTPVGREILTRLRAQLDGGDGTHMPVNLRPREDLPPPDGKENRRKNKAPLGTFTIGHVAGYGLLWQLTGERHYAELGARCFEYALKGVRDRDRRYSFRAPDGELRAGPSLGWMAVGFDLCADGWTATQRERFGRALAEYRDVDLEILARGDMPPESNHFGMMVGGAALALLAVDGEPWVDQQRIDRLLRLVEHSLIRNLHEGFGDGGFFAEGDGTGSMSSQIVYLTALMAFKNAKGKNFFLSEQPNARMMTLKWLYQTIVRDGKPHMWPIRGGYRHNVWARQGVSGAGYFSIGIGSVRPAEQQAMKWFYETFLLEADRSTGGAYDTVGPYPHHGVSAFVNWPSESEPVHPETVMPHCYRQRGSEFYCWRNRWRDGDDLVITGLLNATKGYMGANAERTLALHHAGERLKWGTLVPGTPRYWSMSATGDTSSLTMSDGTAIGVDFTGSAGVDTLLVTTGEAKGSSVTMQGRTFTIHAPTTVEQATARIDGDAIVVGNQRIRWVDDHLEFAIDEAPAP